VTVRWIALAGILAFVGAEAARAQERSRQEAARVGSLILFWSDTPWPSLWSIRPDGSRRRRVFRTHQNCKRPFPSPDRTWIAFDGTPPGQRPLSQFDIQVVRRDGTGRRTLVPSPDRETDPQWSPDGARISYVRLAEADEEDWRKSWIWSVRPDGSGLRRLLATPRLEWPSDWSPDGKKILFTRELLGGTNVYVMNTEGSNVRRLTHARGEDFGGTWSPDGTRIVFTSKRFRLAHLFVMKANGRGEHQLTRRNAEDFEPSWF
jgi:eukaryotic-like serine/threonine-protein kinase